MIEIHHVPALIAVRAGLTHMGFDVDKQWRFDGWFLHIRIGPQKVFGGQRSDGRFTAVIMRT